MAMELTFSEPITFPVVPTGRLLHHEDRDVADFPGEEWKEIEGYDGLYLISNYGRTKSLKCKYPKIMKIDTKRHHCSLFLNHKGVIHCHMPGREVWKAFIGEIPGRLRVIHKNGIYSDSRLENLMLVEYYDAFLYHIEESKAEDPRQRVRSLTNRYVQNLRRRYVHTKGLYPDSYSHSELEALLGHKKDNGIVNLLTLIRDGEVKKSKCEWIFKEVPV